MVSKNRKIDVKLGSIVYLFIRVGPFSKIIDVNGDQY